MESRVLGDGFDAISWVIIIAMSGRQMACTLLIFVSGCTSGAPNLFWHGGIHSGGVALPHESSRSLCEVLVTSALKRRNSSIEVCCLQGTGLMNVQFIGRQGALGGSVEIVLCGHMAGQTLSM